VTRSPALRSTLALLAALLTLPAVHADDAPERALAPDSTGEVYTATAADGLRYEYYIPKDYDPDVGASLTLVLHGSNLDRRWGFANHAAGSFRPHDVVVCPDGTTSNGAGGFNSLQRDEDLERLHALHEELRATLKLGATYLYGHSQGSFFAFYYAGRYPEDVQGVVGQASGVWIGTEAGRKQHHQAIVLMHGTDDPVVPYGQSVGGLSFYRDAKYPLARLRPLRGWNHWPDQLQTEQQLAWCEGMTTDDPARLAACFETLDGMKEWRDPVALRQVAARAADDDDVPARVRRSAEKAVEEVDEVAGDHVRAIERSLGKSKGKKLEEKAWVGHLPLFLLYFEGVPAAEELAGDWERTLERHAEKADEHTREYWRLKQDKPKDAFLEGLALLEEAFLDPKAANEERLAQLEAWREGADGVELERSTRKLYDATVPVYRAALEEGREAFDKVDRVFR
jgi:pimeloyl-ACP methyl ester carboxylesterase